MEFNVYSLLLDLMWASIFLFIAKLLREKIKLLQSLFIPVSLLAGFIGLAMGQNGFGIIKYSSGFGSYSGLLIIAVFVSIGLRGFNFSKGGWKTNFDRIGSYYCQRNIGWAFQYAVPIVFSMIILKKIVPELNPAFGMLIPAGFQGGHGTAAALGQTLGSLGWADATDLGMTSATVGILTGIFGGIALIKIGTRKGYTKFVKDFSKLPEDMRTGRISKENRSPMGYKTVSPMAIDPLAWHLLLVIIPTGIGYILTNYIQNITGLGVPSFSVGFLVAIFFSIFLRGIKANEYIDNHIISRIGSCCTDFLVFFGVASIKIPVIIEYALPFGLLMLFGIIWVVFHFTFIAPRLLGQEWFERGIYVYGYSTGVTAIGMALLRIVDPENKSCTLDDAAIITPIEAVIEIVALAVVPVACVQGNWIAAITPILIYLIALIIIPIIFKWWHKHPKGLSPEDL
ncbi:sodium/glutamate symporter [Fusobacterium perfoetens]|uniref:sodium/glutamate symporter n=1 Tax=Fusobacterium perfoetens TaxID=852 RepID=UPI0026E9DFA2|nr:sodium/glutamate symporter [Fusobacterium perfoetens]